MNKYQQLISTLNQLFQTDQEELDFGIYRIMNQKRSEINSFLETDLKKAVTEGLSQIEQSGTESLAKELENVVSSLKSAGVDPDTAPKVIELKKQLNASNATEDAENDIYSHLVDFFSRYYLEGDFISQRRYKDDVYAIPYQGEEVKLYWANYDQYYIKTTENFSSYSFKLDNGKSVIFRLVEAATERDNNKIQNGEERRFKLIDEDFIKENENNIEIFFEYLPLGKKTSQDDLDKTATKKLLDSIPAEFEELKTLTPTKKNKDRTLLEKRIKEYTSKNTMDYFIHKDLGKFLERELDFFIKNELLNVDDLESNLTTNNDLFVKVRVFKSIATKVINFIEQLENFQKMLWEKKKFVVQSDYLITLDHVDEKYYADISNNQKQVDQWIELGFLTGKSLVDEKYLKNHKYLTVDTHLFPKLKDDFISDIDDLDTKTNGVLINSENWQALNLVSNRYSKSIDITYIDPPYNTSENTFVYKNQYKHSSWIAMMSNRLLKSHDLLNEKGVIQVAIDDTELAALKLILSDIYGRDNFLANFAIQVNPAGQNIRPNSPALSHDYFLVYAKDIEKSTLNPRPLTDEEKKQYPEEDDKGRYYWDNLRRRGGNSRPSDRPNQWFPLFIEPRSKKISTENFEGATEVWPVDSKGIERIWRYNKEGVEKELKNGEIGLIKVASEWRISKKSRMPEGKMPKTLWWSSKYSATSHGTKLLQHLFNQNLFSYPKSVHLVKDAVYHWSNKESLVVDFFAGSGTTAHATIRLNREDSGNRKYILVEMGRYFKSVTKPRVQKIIYSDNWKDGKPQDSDGISQIVKYLSLESYEDTLNNLVFNQTENQQSLLSSNSDLKEDYFLRYMLDVETRESSSLLNIDELKEPFNYSLLITSDNEQKRQKIDVAETFNYLIGLHVNKRFKKGDCLIYTGTQHQTHNKIVVIWRNVEKTSDKDIQAIVNSLESENDIVFVNGQTIASSKQCEVLQLEPEFKRRMFN